MSRLTAQEVADFGQRIMAKMDTREWLSRELAKRTGIPANHVGQTLNRLVSANLVDARPLSSEPSMTGYRLKQETTP